MPDCPDPALAADPLGPPPEAIPPGVNLDEVIRYRTIWGTYLVTRRTRWRIAMLHGLTADKAAELALLAPGSFIDQPYPPRGAASTPGAEACSLSAERLAELFLPDGTPRNGAA